MFKGQVLDCLNPGFVKIRWSRFRSIRIDGHDVISRMFRDKKKRLFSVVQVHKVPHLEFRQ